jgi:hypothetical protein
LSPRAEEIALKPENFKGPSKVSKMMYRKKMLTLLFIFIFV